MKKKLITPPQVVEVHECEALYPIETNKGLLDQCKCGKVEFPVYSGRYKEWRDVAKCDVCNLFIDKDDTTISTVVEPHYTICKSCRELLGSTKNHSKEYRSIQRSYEKMPEVWVKYFKKIEKEQGISFKKKKAA